MLKTEIRNAKVYDVFLGFEDHGIFTCYVRLDYGGACQSFGGYMLDTFDKERDRRIGTAYGSEWLIRLLNTLEIGSIDELKGISVRAKCAGGTVRAIGHFLKDQWFEPEEDLKWMFDTEVTA